MLNAALRIGTLCGAINVIAPDHLGTLMTLSALCVQRDAFYIGACWGIGHSIGTILICGIFIALKAAAVKGIAAWEHYGEYFVGASMVFCALYFALNEHKYLKEQEDGTVAAVPCSCNHFGAQTDSNPHASNIDSNAEFVCVPCIGPETPSLNVCKPQFGYMPCVTKQTPSSQLDEDVEEPETAPLLPQNGNAHKSDEMEDSLGTFYGRCLPSGRHTQGAFIGLLQGMCCPTGLVGISFVAGMGNSQEIIGFLTAFILVSVVGTGLVAVGWSVISGRGMGKYIGPRIVYRGSCVFTLALGIAWVSANYSGWSIDYTEQFNDQLNLTAVTTHSQTLLLARPTVQPLLNQTHRA